MGDGMHRAMLRRNASPLRNIIMSQLFLANSCHIMDFPYSMGMPLGYTFMEFHSESAY